jgi:sugar lactone lactonase YvrE
MTEASNSRSPVPCSTEAGLLSEGPRWDAERDELLWVDIVGWRLHRGRLDPRGMIEQLASVKFDRGEIVPSRRA